MSDVLEAHARENVITRKKLPAVADRAFLPADLEILETPPSPVRLAFIAIICGFAFAAVIWSWIGRIDIVAVAHGKLQPTGRVKVIEPLEPGKVAAINVENGRHVSAGEVLVEMDSGDAVADVGDARSSYDGLRAEVMRRRAAVLAARSKSLAPPPAISWDDDIPPDTRARENQVLSGDMRRLADMVASFDAQIRQKEIEADQFARTVAAQEKLVAILQERVDMRSALARSGAGTKAALIDAEETLQYHTAQLSLQVGQREAAKANADVLARERDKVFSEFIADNAQKLADAHRQAEGWYEKLTKANLKSRRMSLTSPIDGTVYGLSLTTIGQVVAGGEEVMRIVPEGAKLEIEVYVLNEDAGFVRAGDNAVVKVESFPFTRYGTLPAHVERVASDAIPEAEAQQREADAARSPRDRTTAGGQRTQNLVYPATLTLAVTAMDVDGQIAPLKPGMAVTVEIATGSRRILEYIFAPLVGIASSAMKER